MNIVEPIRDVDVIRAIQADLRATDLRNYVLFMVGIYTGLRISDILKLRVSDLKKQQLVIRQKKNKKQVFIPINPDLRKAVADYIRDKPDDEMLFLSRQVKLKVRIKREISRSSVYKMLNRTAGKYGLSSIGCHTLRKTFGYHFYMTSEKNIALLMEIFGHSDPSITLRYIGITQDTINSAMLRLRYSLNHK